MKKNEESFKKSLQRYSNLANCCYTHIPDVLPQVAAIMRKKYGPRAYIAEPRPCDGILSTPKNNYFVELKYGNNQPTDRQKKFGKTIHNLNNKFLVLRKRIVRKKLKYSIENIFHVKLHECDTLVDMLQYIVTAEKGD